MCCYASHFGGMNCYILLCTQCCFCCMHRCTFRAWIEASKYQLIWSRETMPFLGLYRIFHTRKRSSLSTQERSCLRRWWMEQSQSLRQRSSWQSSTCMSETFETLYISLMEKIRYLPSGSQTRYSPSVLSGLSSFFSSLWVKKAPSALASRSLTSHPNEYCKNNATTTLVIYTLLSMPFFQYFAE